MSSNSMQIPEIYSILPLQANYMLFSSINLNLLMNYIKNYSLSLRRTLFKISLSPFIILFLTSLNVSIILFYRNPHYKSQKILKKPKLIKKMKFLPKMKLITIMLYIYMDQNLIKLIRPGDSDKYVAYLNVLCHHVQVHSTRIS